MAFDARAASKLEAGQHLTFDDFPGLRLEVSSTRKSWIYRYKSPINSSMRQIKLGGWPAMGFPAAISEWERQRAARDSGEDPAVAKRQAKSGIAPAPAAGI